MSLNKLWEIVKDREAWCFTVHGATKSRTHLVTERQQLIKSFFYGLFFDVESKNLCLS